MSINAEDENNIQQSITRTHLSQSQAITNSYEDEPPPYSTLQITANIHPTTTYFLPKRSSTIHNQSISVSNNRYSSENVNPRTQGAIQTRQWKTSYNQYHICYTGDLPDDFLRIKPSLKSEITNQKQSNIKLSTTIQLDQSIPLTSYHFNTKLSTSKILKTPKIRARMLQNVLTQIEQGQIMKTSMVPEEPITQSDGYAYEKNDLFTNKIPFLSVPFVVEYDLFRS